MLRLWKCFNATVIFTRAACCQFAVTEPHPNSYFIPGCPSWTVQSSHTLHTHTHTHPWTFPWVSMGNSRSNSFCLSL